MKIFKFLRLPTPKETGKSLYNSLPLRSIQPKSEGYSWEEYYNDMKKQYPIKYFINRIVPRYFRRYISTPLENFRYYIVSHTIRKYHLLDLRNSEYEYGWADADSQLLYATMAVLENFIIEQNTASRLNYLTENLKTEKEEYIIVDSIKQIEFCNNLLEIQKWWREEFPKTHWQMEDGLYEKQTEMIKRVIDLRAGMWT